MATATATAVVPHGMQTAVYYDPDSLKHVVPDFHCECPARIEQVVELVEELALHHKENPGDTPDKEEKDEKK